MNKNLKNIISLFSIEFIARLLGLIAVTYLARVLGKSNFGIINIGSAILGYAAIISNGGLTLLGTRKVAGQPQELETLTGNIILTRIIFAFVIFSLSIMLVLFFVESKTVAETAMAYLLFLFPNAVLLEWLFHGKQKMEVIALGRILGSLVYLIFVFLFVLNSNDVVLTGLGWTFAGVLNAIFLVYFFYKSKNRVVFNIKTFKFLSLFKESFSLGVASILAQFVVAFPIIYLGIVASNSEAGVYSAAYKIIVILLIFDRIFGALFFPKIIQFYNLNPKNLNEMFNKILKIISAIGLCVSFLAIVCGKNIVNIIFGSQYSEATSVFQILIISFYFTLLSSVFVYTLIGIHKEKIYTNSLIIGTVVFLISLIFLVEHFGVEGAAYAYAVFEITVCGFLSFKLNREFKIEVMNSVVVPLFTALMAAAGIIFLNLNFAVQLAVAFFIGIPLIMFSARIKSSELNFIKRVFI